MSKTHFHSVIVDDSKIGGQVECTHKEEATDLVQARRDYLWRTQMFHIAWPIKVQVQSPFLSIMQEAYIGGTRDQMNSMNRQFFMGDVEPPPRRIIAKRCDDQGMLARLHDWDITYEPARPCYQCEGRLEFIEYDYEDNATGIAQCQDCNAGWVSERWTYRCRRCNSYNSKT
jgi:hypothetical protein